MIRVNVTKSSNNAIIPCKKTAKDTDRRPDFGYDLTATSVEHARTDSGEIIPNTWVYGCGIALQVADEEIGDGTDFVPGFAIRPRSSVWKTGMMLTNSVGTIDAGYTGEIKAVFFHYNPNLPKYEVGDRIGQLILESTEKCEFAVVERLGSTTRADGGYGSSGK